MYRVTAERRSSWFTAAGSRSKSMKLAEELRQRFGRPGQPGFRPCKFVTLTYDQSRWGGDVEKCYEASSRDRHVREFIGRLSRHLKAKHGDEAGSLRGKWMRKLEFQSNGWPHFHLLIDFGPYIDQRVLQDLWGWGIVDVRDGHRKEKGKRSTRIEYVAKYAAKSLDSLPGYMLQQPAGSYKIVAVSPGFWDGIRKPPRKKREGLGLNPTPKMKLKGGRAVYRTVGVMLADGSHRRTVLECIETHNRETYVETFVTPLPVESVLVVCALFGASLYREPDGSVLVSTDDGNGLEAALSAAAAEAAAAAAAADFLLMNPLVPRIGKSLGTALEYLRWREVHGRRVA